MILCLPLTNQWYWMWKLNQQNVIEHCQSHPLVCNYINCPPLTNSVSHYLIYLLWFLLWELHLEANHCPTKCKRMKFINSFCNLSIIFLIIRLKITIILYHSSGFVLLQHTYVSMTIYGLHLLQQIWCYFVKYWCDVHWTGCNL